MNTNEMDQGDPDDNNDSAEEEEEEEEEESEEIYIDDDDDEEDEFLDENSGPSTGIEFLFSGVKETSLSSANISYEKLYVSADSFVEEYYENWNKKMNFSSISILLIDIRSEELFKKSHLFGSINVPMGTEKLTEHDCVKLLEDKRYDLLFDWVRYYGIVVYGGTESFTGCNLKCPVNKRSIHKSKIRKELCYDPSSAKQCPLVSFVNVFLKSYYFYDICHNIKVIRGGFTSLKTNASGLIHDPITAVNTRLKEYNSVSLKKNTSRKNRSSKTTTKDDSDDRGLMSRIKFIHFESDEEENAFNDCFDSMSAQNQFGINFGNLNRNYTIISRMHISERNQKNVNTFTKLYVSSPKNIFELNKVLGKISHCLGSGFVFVTSDRSAFGISHLLSLCSKMNSNSLTLAEVMLSRNKPQLPFEEYTFTDEQWRLLFEYDADSLNDALGMGNNNNSGGGGGNPFLEQSGMPVKLRHFPTVSIKHVEMYKRKSLTFHESLQLIPSLGEIEITHRFSG